jgi:hypothetical protein
MALTAARGGLGSITTIELWAQNFDFESSKVADHQANLARIVNV